MTLHTRPGLQSIDTALLPKRLPNCATNEEEFGQCKQWCGRAICLMRSDCTAPRQTPQRSLWFRFVVRPLRIFNARLALAELEQHYGNLKGSGWTDLELKSWARKIGAARVDLAIARR